MARRGSLARRSGREWAVRWVLAVLVALLGVGVVTGSVAALVRGRDPAQAHRLAPYDGRWTALLATALSGGEATTADRQHADVLARTALRQNPTAVQAVGALGINAQVRGDSVGARRLFAYAQRLSRRDLMTQLWAIEDAVAQGDIPGVLRHYDIALRTSRNAPELLFPVLTTAIDDPAVRTALLRTLARRPSWGVAFAEHVAGNGAPRVTAELFRGMRRLGVPVTELSQATVVGRLLTADAVAEAWAHYATLRPDTDRRVSRDPSFRAAITVPTPFDWVPLSDGGVITTLQPGAQGGTFEFSAPTSVGGPVLQQLQFLPAGAYLLDGHTSGIEQAPDTLPFWQLTCRDGRELGRVAVPNSRNAGGMFHGAFSVPPNCPVQLLVLSVRPSDAIGGVAGQIDRVRLQPR